jgi:hypothetical protein
MLERVAEIGREQQRSAAETSARRTVRIIGEVPRAFAQADERGGRELRRSTARCPARRRRAGELLDRARRCRRRPRSFRSARAPDRQRRFERVGFAPSVTVICTRAVPDAAGRGVEAHGSVEPAADLHGLRRRPWNCEQRRIEAADRHVALAAVGSVFVTTAPNVARSPSERNRGNAASSVTGLETVISRSAIRSARPSRGDGHDSVRRQRLGQRDVTRRAAVGVRLDRAQPERERPEVAAEVRPSLPPPPPSPSPFGVSTRRLMMRCRLSSFITCSALHGRLMQDVGRRVVR